MTNGEFSCKIRLETFEGGFIGETGNIQIRDSRWKLFYIGVGSAVLLDGVCRHKLFDFGDVCLHCVSDCQLHNVCLLGIPSKKTLVDKDDNLCFNERSRIGYQSTVYVDFCGIGRTALYACEDCSRLYCDNLELHHQANGVDSLGARVQGQGTSTLIANHLLLAPCSYSVLAPCPYFKE